MAIYHLSARDPITRRDGKSSTAAAAYRACALIFDERTGEVYDYTKKRGLKLDQLMLPSNQKVERSDFWNAVERHHKRGDAQVAREVIAALPVELSDEQRAALAMEFSAEISLRYGVAVDLCVHAAGRGDERNEHAHILMSSCVVASNGRLGKKVQELDPIWCKRNKKPTLVDWARPRWEELCNAALERAGSAERIEHRSHAARRLPDLPTVKVGNGPGAARRREKNKEIRQVNSDLRTALKKRGQARAADLANRFISPISIPRKDLPMNPETIQKITSKIDALLAQPGPTLEDLRSHLRPLGVTTLEDRGKDFYWALEGKPTPETELGQAYTRHALLARGLVLEEPKKSLGFITPQEINKPGQQQADDDLADALRTLLEASRLLSAGAQNLLIQFLNWVLKLLNIDYQIKLKKAVISQATAERLQPEIEGAGHGRAEDRKTAVEGVKNLTRQVLLVTQPSLDKARLERAIVERTQLHKEERAAAHLSIMGKTTHEKREAEKLHKELMTRRARLDLEIEEMKMQLEPHEQREEWLREELEDQAAKLQEQQHEKEM